MRRLHCPYYRVVASGVYQGVGRLTNFGWSLHAYVLVVAIKVSGPYRPGRVA